MGRCCDRGALPCLSTAVSGARRLIEAICRDLRLKLATVPGATVRPGGTSFVDPSFGCTREGCALKLAGNFDALKEQPSPDSWLGEYLEAKGWVRTLSHDADSPDGTTYALHRPGALCIVEGIWNHWHDDNNVLRVIKAPCLYWLQYPEHDLSLPHPTRARS